MRSVTSLAFALAFIASLIFVTTGPASQSVKLIGNHPAITAKPAGPIAPDRVLTMSIVFKPGNPQELNRLLSQQQDPSSPNYHRWLTPEEFSRRFAPDPKQVEAVRAWLVAQGFEIVSFAPPQRSIVFKGSAGMAEQVFKTRIVTYPGDAYANVTDPSVPARFAAIIGAIRGLDNTTRAVPGTN